MSIRSIQLSVSASVLFAGILLAPGAHAATLFVDQSTTGAQTGTSWADAFGDLNAALEASRPDDEILIAAGLYRPGPIDDRTASFTLLPGISLRGGFPAGGADAPTPDVFVTTLSGDIGNPGDSTDNALHVVTVTGDGVSISGVTIAHGMADSLAGLSTFGGGVFAIGSAPNLTDCVFEDNHAADGGGAVALFSGGSFTLSACVFRRNTTPRDGGAMYAVGASNPIMTDCSFEDNHAGRGGGLFLLAAEESARVEHSIFADNTAEQGGGLYIDGGMPSIVDCRFRDNRGTLDAGGGAGAVNHDSGVIYERCTFTRNTTIGQGGAMRNEGGSPEVRLCTFLDNSAGFGGGGVANTGGTIAHLADCTFAGNVTIEFRGGGAYNTTNSLATFLRCTFTDNHGFFGGGIAISNADVTLNRCQLDANQGSFGGGLSVINGEIQVDDCVFLRNSALEGGAVRCVSNTVGTIRNCRLEDNTASSSGGGISCRARAAVAVDLCRVTGNTARIGAGIAINNAAPRITNTLIDHNVAAEMGGGILMEDSATPLITRCVLRSNTADLGGGVSVAFSARPQIIATTIAENVGLRGGGGLLAEKRASLLLFSSVMESNSSGVAGAAYIRENAVVRFVNSTVVANIAEDVGGVLVESAGRALVRNSIIADNALDQLKASTDSAIVSWSIIRGGWPGLGNIDADPRLDSVTRQLLPDSPGIDAGANNALPLDEMDADGDGSICDRLEVDFELSPRVQAVLQPANVAGCGGPGVVDIGAFEFQGADVTLPLFADVEPVGGDGAVTIDDLLAVFAAFGPYSDCEPADVIANGRVNIDDALAVIDQLTLCD